MSLKQDLFIFIDKGVSVVDKQLSTSSKLVEFGILLYERTYNYKPEKIDSIYESDYSVIKEQ